MSDYATTADSRWAAARARGEAFMAEPYNYRGDEHRADAMHNRCTPTICACGECHQEPEHTIVLKGRPMGWQAVCSCGAKSGTLTTSGMVAGWEANHLNAAEEGVVTR